MLGPDGYPTDCTPGPEFSFVSVAEATTRADAICALAHNVDQGLWALTIAAALVVLLLAVGVYAR